MNWMAAHEQKEDALLRVFFMLVASFLLTIRTGLDPRIACVLLPLESEPNGDAPTFEMGPSSTPDGDFRCRALMLLCAIECVRQRLIALMMRAVFELMNQAFALANPPQAGKPANPFKPRSQRLDSS